MKKLSIFLTACFFVVTAFADPSADLNQLLTNIRSMQANFSQTITGKANRVIQESSGSMALQRPGQFRWEVRKPIAQLIVANGKKLWIYDKDLEQVTIRSLSKAAGGEAPGLLLSDANPVLEKDFYVKQVTSPTADSKWFLLLPKDKSSMYSSIRIGFTHQQMTDMQLQDHLGQTTTIKFKNIKMNTALASSFFRLAFPKNVDVIDETR